MLRGSRHLGKILGYFFSPFKFHLSLLGSLESRRTWRHLAVTVGTSRKRGGGGGEQGVQQAQCLEWQPAPWLRTLIVNNNVWVFAV
jgi:hypothetical protein